MLWGRSFPQAGSLMGDRRHRTFWGGYKKIHQEAAQILPEVCAHVDDECSGSPWPSLADEPLGTITQHPFLDTRFSSLTSDSINLCRFHRRRHQGKPD